MKTRKLIIALSVLVIVLVVALVAIRLGLFENQADLQKTDKSESDQPLLLKTDNPGSNQVVPSSPLTEEVASSSEKMKVKVFFNNNKLDPEVTCNKVFPVEREVDNTPAIARVALEELLKGTTPAEEEAGFMTSLNPNVKIQGLTIENGVAKVDFDEQLEAAVGGSCRVSAISAQIRETLKQFSSVESVIISINGRTEDILQP
jgi:spore germination protein GerM